MNLLPHQLESVAKMRSLSGFFDMSDPGTGKTRVELADFWARRQYGGGRALVVAPKSILQPAWGDEIDKAAPGMTYSIAWATNREKAFRESTDVVITNHDAAKWISERTDLLRGFDTLIVDESTAFKNPIGIQRTKAMMKLSERFEWVRCLTGTPNPNTILDVWAQAYLLDNGERLGKSYYAFRNVSCTPVQVGPGAAHLEWRDKPGIADAVFALLSDISIRHPFVSRGNAVSRFEFELSPKAREVYDDMERHAIALVGDTTITALHASAVMTKLMQIASGAVYNGDDYTLIDTTRYELIMDLIEERRHCLVAFEWRHQCEELMKAAKKRGFSCAFMHGDTPRDERTAIVRRFQAGELRVLFAHPRTAGHGLTLTKGTTTIWSSPTFSSELFKQFNARIDRTGQTEQVETIMVSAKRTVDNRAYAALGTKLSAMDLLLSLMEGAR